MRHRDTDGPGFFDPDLAEFTDRHPRHRGGHGGRLFGYGERRLLLLALIADKPRHGYELIKAIEERMGGTYSPSPGVIYPTLAWLGDMGYATTETEEGGRKSYRITPEGEAFLTANRAAVEALLARAGPIGAERRGPLPAPVLRAMENLRIAIRLRFRRLPISQEAAEKIAAALDAAAQIVERS
jgi:DNA-binding PadR family transcriptional regulator